MTPAPAALRIDQLDHLPAWHVLGDQVRPVADGSAHGWDLFEIRSDGPMGPPPHRHPWAELFLVLEGQLDVFDGAAWRRAGPGAVVHVPADGIHTYRAAAPGTRFLALISPAGMGTFFQDMARQVTMPPDPATVMAICTRHGVEVVPQTGP